MQNGEWSAKCLERSAEHGKWMDTGQRRVDSGKWSQKVVESEDWKLQTGE